VWRRLAADFVDFPNSSLLYHKTAAKWYTPPSFLRPSRGARKKAPRPFRQCGKDAGPMALSVLEHVLQLFEKALALFVVVVLEGVLKGLQRVALGAGELFGDL